MSALELVPLLAEKYANRPQAHLISLRSIRPFPGIWIRPEHRPEAHEAHLYSMGLQPRHQSHYYLTGHAAGTTVVPHVRLPSGVPARQFSHLHPEGDRRRFRVHITREDEPGLSVEEYSSLPWTIAPKRVHLVTLPTSMESPTSSRGSCQNFSLFDMQYERHQDTQYQHSAPSIAKCQQHRRPMVGGILGDTLPSTSWVLWSD
jgi:hypothetical protein